MKKELRQIVEIPEGTEVTVDGTTLTFKGPEGENKRTFNFDNLNFKKKDNQLILENKKATKREKRLIGTFKSHIKNIIQGVSEGHVYKLKICSTHFPMSVSIKDNEFEVQNYLGEKVPRKFKLKEGVDVKIEGEEITVESIDKEAASQTAASIEQLCKITNKDRRIFQDGIYITLKSKKTIK